MLSPSRLAASMCATALVGAGGLALAGGAQANTVTVNLVSSSSYVSSGSYRHVQGEVRNDGTLNAGSVKVNLNLLDANGRLLATDFTYARLSPFTPGEKSPFQTMFEMPAGYDRYTISLSPDTAYSTPNRNFTTTVTNEFTDSIDYRHIVGTVRNDNTTTAESVNQVATFYDAAGTVVATDIDYVDSRSNSTLAAGETGTFELETDRPFSSYKIVTQSYSAPSTSGSTPTPTQPATRPSAQPTPSSASPAPTASPSAEDRVPSVSVAPSAIDAGQRVTVTYVGSPDTTLAVYSKTQPATVYSRITSVTLDSNGYGTTSHAPSKNTRIMARTADGKDSAAPLIQVRSVASFTASRISGRTYAFTGRVYPARNQRLVNIYRSGVLLAQARTDANGIYRVSKTMPVGSYSLQARTSDDTYNLGATSPTRLLRVG